jgi:hypothetical protein
MAHSTCKRVWEGTLGVAITPRKKQNGEYFWTFHFVRAFRRTRNSNWEYAQQFGQQHATALGLLMSKAFHFMQENDPAKFLESAMAVASRSAPPTDDEAEPAAQSAPLPLPNRAAA